MSVSENFVSQTSFEPLTLKNWKQFEALFGEKGACGNCWCMYYRLRKSAFDTGKTNLGNKKAMYDLVKTGYPTGLLALYQDQAIGWLALAPREDYPRLENSRVHKRIDNEAVWSIPCTFIAKGFRRKGFSIALLKGAIAYARENRITLLEAYPAIPTQEKLPDAFAWIGLYTAFEKAGFKIVDRKSPNRPMVRYSTKE